MDSTVITVEGIDTFAEFLGKGRQVAEITRAAMNGDMPFEDALNFRLQAMNPTEQQLCNFLSKDALPFTPGVQAFVADLHRSGKHVYLVSGGFEEMILPLAQALGIADNNVFANRLIFDHNGTYEGIDSARYTSRKGGKARAVAAIQQALAYDGYLPAVCMIGDGATDVEAKPPAAFVIGFGGVVERAAVRAMADFYVWSFDELQRQLTGSNE